MLRALLITIASSIVLVLLLRWLPPPTSAFMIAARAQAMLDGNFRYRNEYDWVPLEAISPHAAMAAIAAEDQLFPFHTGFDFESIRKAVQYNARGKRVRGASTITQQTAKNLFLWSGRSWVRKGLEVYFTVLIEVLWPKDRILEVYLNLAQFGRGVYGVQAASREFFGKDAAKLTRRQSALLAAVLPNPIKLRAAAPSPYVLRRTERIMGQIRALGGAAYLRQLDDAEPR